MGYSVKIQHCMFEYVKPRTICRLNFQSALLSYVSRLPKYENIKGSTINGGPSRVQMKYKPYTVVVRIKYNTGYFLYITFSFFIIIYFIAEITRQRQSARRQIKSTGINKQIKQTMQNFVLYNK